MNSDTEPPESEFKIVEEYLQRFAPLVMKEFSKKPWNYRFYFPCSMEDYLTLTALISIGEKECERTYFVQIDLASQKLLTIKEVEKGSGFEE